MQNDESIWSCIGNDGFCSFKVKVKQPPTTFCRNKYNVTGLCNRTSCPLANGEYGTVLEEEGVCYLNIKTVERAHTPKNMWERIKLPKNFAEALQLVEKSMEYWPEHKVNRCKQRLTKIRQMLLRSRRLELRAKPKLVGIKKKTERREMGRELKAETAAKVDLAVEQELLNRLQQGMYGDIYNFDTKAFENVLEKCDGEEEEEEEETEDEEAGEIEFAAGSASASSVEDDEDEDVAVGAKRKRPPVKAPPARRRKMEIEYEAETDRVTW
jgi:protein MAK16